LSFFAKTYKTFLSHRNIQNIAVIPAQAEIQKSTFIALRAIKLF